jgi:hypothetical protein
MQHIKKLTFVFIVVVNRPALGTISHVMNHFFTIMGFILLSHGFFFLWIFCLTFLCFRQFVVVLVLQFVNFARVCCYPFFWVCKSLLLFLLILLLQNYLGKIGQRYWRTPNSSKDPNVGPSSSGRRRSRGTLPSSQHLRGRGACWSSGMGLGRVDKLQSLTRAYTRPSQSG